MVEPPLGPVRFFAGPVSGVTYGGTEPRAMGTETRQHFSPTCLPDCTPADPQHLALICQGVCAVGPELTD